MSFDRLIEKIRKTKNPAVMGLDPRIEYVPKFIRDKYPLGEALFEFNKGLIDCAADLIPAVKPQSAFYEMYGIEGLEALGKTVAYAKEAGLYVILDGKRNDIGSTAEAYAEAAFGEYSFGADCVTVNGYLGSDGIIPFVKAAEKYDKSIFVLVKTSNPSSSEFQNLDCGGMKLYRRVAEKVEKWGENNIGTRGYSRVGAVVGATYPAELKELRSVMRHTFFLIPGYGAQGGSAADVIAAFDRDGSGAIVNSSRALICAYKNHPDEENYQKYTREAVLKMKEDLGFKY